MLLQQKHRKYLMLEKRNSHKIKFLNLKFKLSEISKICKYTLLNIKYTLNLFFKTLNFTLQTNKLN